MQSPESLFSARIAADPGRPLVTFYDDATGERAELSAKSLGNWVAKTHFLLIDELGLGVGDRAFVSLPVHWLAAAVLLGCWFAGLEVVTEPGDAVIAFGDVASLSAADLDSVGDVLAVSLLSMARSAEAPAETVATDVSGTSSLSISLASRVSPDIETLPCVAMRDEVSLEASRSPSLRNRTDGPQAEELLSRERSRSDTPTHVLRPPDGERATDRERRVSAPRHFVSMVTRSANSSGDVRGSSELRGIPGEWQPYAVER